MKDFTLVTKYGEYENCNFNVQKYYSYGGRVSIEVWDDEPILKATVNLDVPIPEGCVAIKNYSENEGIDKELIRLGVIEEKPVLSVSSGFVEIPVYKLTKEFVDTFL